METIAQRVQEQVKLVIGDLLLQLCAARAELEALKAERAVPQAEPAKAE